jgi:hypothetical protein
MKKTLIVVSLFLLIGCKSKINIFKSKENQFKVLSLSEVDENQKNKAYDLGYRTLMICNTSKFIPFTESEATQTVIDNTTVEKHSKICLKFRARYGNFVAIKLIETIKNTAENEIIFRYKAIYEHSNANKELRMTLNKDNKISSIKTMNWVDLFMYQ